jgi:uncharacterized protein YdhG (YjbR/CyaY superfamily)
MTTETSVSLPRCASHVRYAEGVNHQRISKSLPSDQRKALKILRANIRAIIPDAEECISYRMPAYRIDGVVVAGFLATKDGCSYYPFSGSTLRTLARDLVGYSQTKGALHFLSEKPLPMSLLRKLIKTRIAETKDV